MLNGKFEFDGRYHSEEYGTITFYFIAPKELLGNKYLEAAHAELSIEFPENYIEAKDAMVLISPTKYDEECDCYVDYEWYDFSLSYEEIEELIALAEKSNRFMEV